MAAQRPQTLDVLKHGLLGRLHILPLLEYKLVIEAILWAPSQLLTDVLPAFLCL